MGAVALAPGGRGMTLHWYFARRTAASFGIVGGLFFLLISLADLIEQARRHGDEGAGLREVVGLTLVNAPGSLYELLPLLVILSAIALFLALARSSEMVVTRASGRSALRALLAPAGVVLVIGLMALAILNPLVAATQTEYEARASALDDRGASVIAVDAGGLWLRQDGPGEGQTVIRAARASGDATRLSGVTFVTFSAEGRPTSRIDARAAELVPGAWRLHEAKTWPLGDAGVPEAAATEQEIFDLPSRLTPEEIRDSFGAPALIPIWDLPRFIERLEAAGFSATRHQMHFQSELALPLFLLALVAICAVFTLRQSRGSRTGLLVLTAIAACFLLYFLRNFALVLGETGQIPVWLAAWAPPVAGAALAMGGLLHLEDG